MNTTLLDIPIHLFFSNIVPLLPDSDLISLATTCKQFRTFFGSSAEHLWKDRLSNFDRVDKGNILRYKLLYDKEIPSFNHIVRSTRHRYMCYLCYLCGVSILTTACTECIRKICLPATSLGSSAKTIQQHFSPELFRRDKTYLPFCPFYLRSDVDLIGAWMSLPELPLTPQEVWHGICPMRQQGRLAKKRAYQRIVDRKQQIFRTQWELAFLYDRDYAEVYLRGPIAPEYHKCVDKAFNSFLPYYRARNFDFFREMKLIRDNVVGPYWGE